MYPEDSAGHILLNHSQAEASHMLACLLKGLGKVALEDVPVPKTGRGDVLIRMRAGGICGTDLEKIHGGYGPGGILGHEVSGVI